jgi:hypothetical protein
MPKHIDSPTHMAQKLRYNKRARKHAYNFNSRWTQPDTYLVMEHSIPDSVLAKQLGRSVQAVHALRNREAMKGGIYV